MAVSKTLSCVPSLHLQPTGTTSAEQVEIQQLLAEENVDVLTEEDRDRLTQLDSLTGVPRGDDVLLFALPMCAPYQVCSGLVCCNGYSYTTRSAQKGWCLHCHRLK